EQLGNLTLTHDQPPVFNLSRANNPFGSKPPRGGRRTATSQFRRVSIIPRGAGRNPPPTLPGPRKPPIIAGPRKIAADRRIAEAAGYPASAHSGALGEALSRHATRQDPRPSTNEPKLSHRSRLAEVRSAFA